MIPLSEILRYVWWKSGEWRFVIRMLMIVNVGVVAYWLTHTESFPDRRAEDSAVWSTRFKMKDGSDIELYKKTDGDMTCSYTMYGEEVQQWFGVLKDTTR